MTIPFWHNVSLVLLVVEAFLLALIPLVVLYFVNRGLRQFRSSLRPFSLQVRMRAQQVEQVTAQVGELIVAPIIAIYALGARLHRILRTIAGLPRKGIHL
ncbi:MAG: hypothetical protein U9Q78_04095 [Chloroflexota bacterium]|nr:hypothetical protein [Chloroflexota bacterium]